ncbi:citrate transporter [Arthrobacter sp. FW305-BF8]|uniref:CitMHS family transporter n=1 Tax=Arthrobacter sp. FW305-BF8 TaxID=2879617 RepID=UPI001F25CA30|nr:SLC13 family permease [Arthrobacter sp. FW305-BF8]UKA55244.1 citrate transporter [Arthrobacter sp. FW305-BF8]
MLVIIVALLISNKATPFSAFTVIPLVIALVAGFSMADIGKFATEGVQNIANTAALQVFGILFFTIMLQAGAFDPFVERILRIAGRSPLKVALATVLLSQLIAFDGDGTATYLIVISAMLPLYRGLGMNPLVLATLVGLSFGVQNMVPWGGPLARAAASLNVGVNDLWIPLLPVQAAGLAAVWAVGYVLGKRETRRLAGAAESAVLTSGGRQIFGATQGTDALAAAGTGSGAAGTGSPPSASTATTVTLDPILPRPSAQMQTEGEEDLTRPRLVWLNCALIVVVIGVLIADVIPAPMVFMLGTIIMLMINYPSAKMQLEVIQMRAREPLMVAAILFSAGIFLGILRGSGMMQEMATTLASSVPDSWGPWLPIIVGLLATPLTLLIDVNSYYLAVLPILAETAQHLGLSTESVAMASLIGNSTVGAPLHIFSGSFWVLIALTGVKIGDHIRFYLRWGCFVSFIMLIAAIIFGLVPLPF